MLLGTAVALAGVMIIALRRLPALSLFALPGRSRL
jgi:hypothetical protein